MPIIFAGPGGGGGNYGGDLVARAQEAANSEETKRQGLAESYAAHQEQMGLEAAKMQQQANQFAQSRDVSPRDAWEAKSRVQSALAINEGQLNQAEQMRLQRLNASLSSIDEALSRGEITDAQAAEMKADINGVRGPLQIRQAQGQVAMQNAQITHLTNLNQIATVQKLRDAQVNAQGLNSMLQPLYDPQRLGQLSSWHMQNTPVTTPDGTQRAMTQQEATQRAQADLHQIPGGVLSWVIPRSTPEGFHLETVARGGNSSPFPTQGATQGDQQGAAPGAQVGGAVGGGTHRGQLAPGQLPPAQNVQLWDRAAEIVEGPALPRDATADERKAWEARQHPSPPGPNATQAERDRYRVASEHWHGLVRDQMRRLQGSVGGQQDRGGQGNAPEQPPTIPEVLSMAEARLPAAPANQQPIYRQAIQQYRRLTSKPVKTPQDIEMINQLTNVLSNMPQPAPRPSHHVYPQEQQDPGILGHIGRGAGLIGERAASVPGNAWQGLGNIWNNLGQGAANLRDQAIGGGLGGQ